MATILIVDDDPLVGQIVCEALADTGHIAGVLGNGRDGLNLIRQRKPDLVILDCNMPEMGGLLVLRELRKDPELYELPVLMLTGRTSERDEALAHYDGADAYVRKQFDPDQLVVVIEDLLAKKNRAAASTPVARKGPAQFGRKIAR